MLKIWKKKQCQKKKNKKTRQLVQTCVVFRASIGGKKKKENQTKKHGDVFLGFHWWKKHAKSNQSSSWWFQPIWKILVKPLPQVWVKIKNIWNDHLDGGFFLRRVFFLFRKNKYLKLRTYWKNVEKMLENHPKKKPSDHVSDQCIRSADDADVFLDGRTSRKISNDAPLRLSGSRTLTRASRCNPSLSALPGYQSFQLWESVGLRKHDTLKDKLLSKGYFILAKMI